MSFPSSASAPPAVRQLRPAMRGLLIAFSCLTALAVVSLFGLAEQTDQTFAWTIQPPLTAAFLGSGYAAGFVLVVLSLREPVWAHSRAPVLTILVFVVLTLVATLEHVNRLHLDDDFSGMPMLPRAAAWFWLGVYVLIPVLMVALLWPQERSPGQDPPARHPVPGVLRAALAVQSGVLLVVGGWLFLDPGPAAEALWPWPLTPFTGQVVAAWLLAFGVATAMAALVGDLARLRTAAVAYTVLGVFVLLSVLRFPGTVDWDRPSAWIFVLVAAAVVVTGAAGWRLAPTPPRSGRG